MKRMCEKNKLLGLILHDLILEQNTKWIKVSMKYLDEVKLHIGDVETNSKREMKEICTIWDNEQWKSDINSKSTLKVHRPRHHEKQIQEEHIYNNHPSSVIWYKARINGLQLNDRNRHTNKETRCIICENEIEMKTYITLYFTVQHTTQKEVKFLNFSNHITITKKC